VDENAAVEFWLTIQGRTAVCGLRLSDATMRHRTYKVEHRPASLRPVVAAAMARLGGAGPGAVVLDPMCGGGTTLAEQLALTRQRGFGVTALGGDIEWGAVTAAGVNLRKVGTANLARWDARRLPLPAESVDRVLCNPPFGKQLGDPDEVRPLYRRLVAECDRVLKPDGRAVLLVGEPEWLRPAAEAAGWVSMRQLRVRLLGQPTALGVWRKGS
jgi:tRNA (guanine6-N2)-methyltransferase